MKMHAVLALVLLSLSALAAVPKSLQLPDDTPAPLDGEVAWPPKKSVLYIPFPTAFVYQTGPIATPMTLWGGYAIDQSIEAARPAVPIERLQCDNTKFCWYFIPACEPLTLFSVREGTGRMSFTDANGFRNSLFGVEWVKVAKTDADSCRAAAMEPPPHIRYSGFGLHIVTAEAAAAPARVTTSVGGVVKPAGIVEVDAVPPARKVEPAPQTAPQ
jgi:hypothetical protein